MEYSLSNNLVPIPASILTEVHANSSETAYLKALSKGRNATPHSWLYEAEDSEVTLERWMSKLEQANSRSPYAAEFNRFDCRQQSKFGPQGEVPSFNTEKAQEVLVPLFSPSEYDDEFALRKYFPDTKAFATAVFGTLKTNRPLCYIRVIDSMRARDTLSTNSGHPRFTRRKHVREEEIQDAVTGRAYEYPALLLFRSYNGKLRPVWMYPMSMNLIESRYEQVIQSLMRHSPTPWVREYVSPWAGYNATKETLTTQWPHPAPILGGDTTKMDAHMRRAQMRLFYEIVKWAFQEQYWDELYAAIMRCCDIPLLVSDHSMLIGPHGLASGAGFTQMSETTLTMFMAWLNKCTGQGIGDDFTWNIDMQPEEVVKFLALFGLPANAEKQDYGTESLSFLQRLNHQGFFSREEPDVLGGYYPTIRALNSLLNPEKFHRPKMWDSDKFCTRCYTILENCIDDPCFDEFLEFVVSGHKDLIPFAKKPASELNRIQREAREIPGLFPSYNQEHRDKPLASFVSIKLASKM